MKDVESWGKWFRLPFSAFCSQRGDHHIRCISEEGLNPSLYYLGLEWPQADTLPHCNQLINTPPPRDPPLAPSTRVSAFSEAGTAVPSQQESSRATLVLDHGMARLSISLSQITLIILLIVQVPMTKGTLRPNSDSSGTTRNTMSLSYPVIPHTCTCRMTNPSGLVHFPPNPTRFNG